VRFVRISFGGCDVDNAHNDARLSVPSLPWSKASLGYHTRVFAPDSERRCPRSLTYKAKGSQAGYPRNWDCTNDLGHLSRAWSKIPGLLLGRFMHPLRPAHTWPVTYPSWTDKRKPWPEPSREIPRKGAISNHVLSPLAPWTKDGTCAFLSCAHMPLTRSWTDKPRYAPKSCERCHGTGLGYPAAHGPFEANGRTTFIVRQDPCKACSNDVQRQEQARRESDAVYAMRLRLAPGIYSGIDFGVGQDTGVTVSYRTGETTVRGLTSEARAAITVTSYPNPRPQNLPVSEDSAAYAQQARDLLRELVHTPGFDIPAAYLAPPVEDRPWGRFRYDMNGASYLLENRHPQTVILELFPDARDLEPVPIADCWLFTASLRKGLPSYPPPRGFRAPDGPALQGAPEISHGSLRPEISRNRAGSFTVTLARGWDALRGHPLRFRVAPVRAPARVGPSQPLGHGSPYGPAQQWRAPEIRG
jgi:hypothetical protein